MTIGLIRKSILLCFSFFLQVEVSETSYSKPPFIYKKNTRSLYFHFSTIIICFHTIEDRPKNHIINYQKKQHKHKIYITFLLISITHDNTVIITITYRTHLFFLSARKRERTADSGTKLRLTQKVRNDFFTLGRVRFGD